MATILNRQTTFATNGTVTAAGLHNLIDQTEIYAGIITTQDQIASVGSSDQLLIADADETSTSAPRRVTVGSMFNDALNNGIYTTGSFTNRVTAGSFVGNLTGNVTGTIVGTTGTIATLNSTTSTITNLSATTSTFLGTITGSTNVINIGSGQIYKDGSGNVGIGNTVASTIISAAGGSNGLVVGTGSGTPNLVLYGGTSNYGGLYFADGTTAGDTFRGYVEYNHASNFLRLGTNTNEGMRIDSSGKVLIGTTSNDTGGRLEVKQGSSETGIGIQSSGTDDSKLYFRTASGDYGGDISFNGSYVKVSSGTTERMRITAGGEIVFGKTSPSSTIVGAYININGKGVFTSDEDAPLFLNRLTNDGVLVEFAQANTLEGTISVSGNTVSYNPFAGSHWSQLEDGSRPEILRGTVLESINQLCQWPDGGNERFAKCKISDTVASKKVYGVFLDWDNSWDQTNDLYVTAVGLFVCRINASVTVQIGDLLESNGDGTARVQADDIIRSSTIGKVTSSVKTHEHPDGSYCVPTVLYCG